MCARDLPTVVKLNYEETELRKVDRTVGVNCNIFSNISNKHSLKKLGRA